MLEIVHLSLSMTSACLVRFEKSSPDLTCSPFFRTAGRLNRPVRQGVPGRQLPGPSFHGSLGGLAPRNDEGLREYASGGTWPCGFRGGVLQALQHYGIQQEPQHVSLRPQFTAGLPVPSEFFYRFDKNSTQHRSPESCTSVASPKMCTLHTSRRF